jgi:uncharacterized membrane protein
MAEAHTVDPPPVDPRQALSEDRTLAIVTYALYLAGYATGGLTTFIGLIIAYARLADSGPVTFSHFRFLIRTFWLFLAWMLIGGFLLFASIPFTVILIGFPVMWLGCTILGLAGVWFGVRCVVGLIYASRDEAYPRPRTWFV